MLMLLVLVLLLVLAGTFSIHGCGSESRTGPPAASVKPYGLHALLQQRVHFLMATRAGDLNDHRRVSLSEEPQNFPTCRVQLSVRMYRHISLGGRNKCPDEVCLLLHGGQRLTKANEETQRRP